MTQKVLNLYLEPPTNEHQKPLLHFHDFRKIISPLKSHTVTPLTHSPQPPQLHDTAQLELFDRFFIHVS